MKKLLVVVVVYNPSFLRLDGIVNEFKKINREIESDLYIVDSGSNNGVTAEYEQTKSFPKEVNFKLLNENVGFGRANNSVIEIAKGEYEFILVMNPDIVVNEPIILNNAVEYLRENENVGMLSPMILNENGQIQYLNRKLPTVFDLGIRFLGPNFFLQRQRKFVNYLTGYDSIQKIENASGSFMLVKTDVFVLSGGFDERYFMYMEDTDFTRRVNEISRAEFFPELTVTHEWQRDNHSFHGIGRMLTSMYKYFNKWGWQLW